MDPLYYTQPYYQNQLKIIFLKDKEKIIIINAERDKKDDMQVGSHPRSELRVTGWKEGERLTGSTICLASHGLRMA